MSSESSEKVPENTEAALAPTDSVVEDSITEEPKKSDGEDQSVVSPSLAAIKLKEEEMLKRIAEMEAKKAEILERIKKMEEIGAKAEKLRQEKLERIARAQEREALLKTENDKLGLRKPKNAEEEAIFNRIVELENRKRAILDRIEDIERVKTKGLEYKERAEKLRQKLEEKRQQQLELEQSEKEFQSITPCTDSTDNQTAIVEEGIRTMNLEEHCDENKNVNEEKTDLTQDTKTVETVLDITSPATAGEEAEHTIGI